MLRPLPPLRPKRAVCGVAGLRSGKMSGRKRSATGLSEGWHHQQNDAASSWNHSGNAQNSVGGNPLISYVAILSFWLDLGEHIRAIWTARDQNEFCGQLGGKPRATYLERCSTRVPRIKKESDLHGNCVTYARPRHRCKCHHLQRS